MLANIKISYLYRDASNYKQFATVVLANPSHAMPDEIYATFGIAFRALQLHPDVIHFKPALLEWDDLFFPNHDPEGSDDFDLHELEVITATNDIPSTPQAVANLADTLARLARRQQP
jgi:hypothetical protein